MEALLRAVEAALATEVVAAIPVHGGDVAAAFRMDLADGRRVFAKTRAHPPAGFFTTEATGLRWLREPDVVPVPEVLAVGDGDGGLPAHLVLEWVDVGPPRSATEADLGRALAELHRAAGNRLVDHQGRSWLIDPAAHGGHREFDLAMMRLFGGFGPACFAAYEEVAPLAPGWEERVALHQIAPLVVHAIKFGGSYVTAATKAISRYA